MLPPLDSSQPLTTFIRFPIPLVILGDTVPEALGLVFEQRDNNVLFGLSE